MGARFSLLKTGVTDSKGRLAGTIRYYNKEAITNSVRLKCTEMNTELFI